MKFIRIPLFVVSIVLVSLMAAFVLAAFGDGLDPAGEPDPAVLPWTPTLRSAGAPADRA